MKANLPVILMLLGLAGTLQCVLPPIPATPLKVPLLAGVSFYYAMERPTLLAVVVAIWAGILTDGLGGVPPGTSAVVLSLMTLALAGLREVVPEGSWTSAALVGALGSPLLALVQVIWLRRYGVIIPFAWPLALALMLMVPVGALAAAGLRGLGFYLDLRAGNIVPRKEVESGGG